MVTGRVIASEAILQPVVELFVYGESDTKAHVRAIVDTGFTEYLTLPAHAIRALNLRTEVEEEFIMANGEPAKFEVYSASIDWNCLRREVDVHRAEGNALIGMAMLRDHDLHVRAIPDGPVSIEPLA